MRYTGNIRETFRKSTKINMWMKLVTILGVSMSSGGGSPTSSTRSYKLRTGPRASADIPSKSLGYLGPLGWGPFGKFAQIELACFCSSHWMSPKEGESADWKFGNASANTSQSLPDSKLPDKRRPEPSRFVLAVAKEAQQKTNANISR